MRVRDLRRDLFGAIVLFAFGLAACRDKDVTVYQAPKEKSASAPGAVPGSALTQTPAARSAAEIIWTVPSGWKELPGSGMRFATFVVPGRGSPDAELSVVVLPGPAGGELANVNRWRVQLGLPPLDEPGLAKSGHRSKTLAGMLLEVDLEGAQDGKKTRMLGGILSADESTWFFKLTGDPSAVGSARPSFHEFLKSLRRPRA